MLKKEEAGLALALAQCAVLRAGVALATVVGATRRGPCATRGRG
ncbi:hypothetical protein A2U01_0003919, partial [Trifolium medium]|nr:hypothetical protein [Trifolium medium]